MTSDSAITPRLSLCHNPSAATTEGEGRVVGHGRGVGITEVGPGGREGKEGGVAGAALPGGG